MCRTSCLLLSVCCWLASTVALSDERDGGARPTIQFVYFDARDVEWVVSAEPERFQRHLQDNAQSAELYHTLTEVVDSQIDVVPVRGLITRWINQERDRFDQSNGNSIRIRKAEGIVAYMRTHDFLISNLVSALLERSAASDVELALVHLIDRTGNASFQLKVMLPDDQIDIGKQGFNVQLSKPRITYTTVVYALALALYEVQEIINGEEGVSEADRSEDLPLPDDLQPVPTDTTLQQPDRPPASVLDGTIR